MTNVKNLGAKQIAGCVLLIAALAAFAWGAIRTSPSANAASAAAPTPVSAVPAAEAEVFHALRTQSPAGVPANVSRWVNRSLMPKFGASSSLGREVASPAGTGRMYLIPARDAVCLYVEDLAGDPGTGAAGCLPLSQVKSQAGIYLQLVDASEGSARSPFPPAGTPFKSTIVGVATDDSGSIAATSADGARHAANVAGDGAFAVTGTGLTELTIQGPGPSRSGGSSLAHG
jgi:hypothetical protein